MGYEVCTYALVGSLIPWLEVSITTTRKPKLSEAFVRIQWYATRNPCVPVFVVM